MVAEQKLEELEGKLAVYEEQQKVAAASMKAEVQQQVAVVEEGLRELYSKADVALINLSRRLDEVEKHAGGNAQREKTRSLVNVKDMKIEKLDKTDSWKVWKADAEYAEEVLPGVKEQLDTAKDSEEEVDELTLDNEETDWWQKAGMLWRFLRRYTSGDSRKIVNSVSDKHGWEAWRKLHQQFEPGLVMREAVVMSQFTNMVNKRARNPGETKTLMVELEEKAKVEEVTGERIDNRHMMSVIMGV